MPSVNVRAKSWPSAILDAFFGCVSALVPPWAIGQVARDSTWFTGLCFYIPSVFMTVMLLGFVLTYLVVRRRRAAAFAACLALPPLAMVLFAENHLFARQLATAPGSHRLVHWNVGGALSRPGTQDKLLAQRADMYVLSEVYDAHTVELFRETLGTQYQSRVFGTLAVIGTGAVQANGWLFDRDGARIQSVTWQQKERRLNLFVVDLPSGIHVARDPLLREVNELIERHRPDLVVGDFNAPRRSWALCEMPPGYRHAYDLVGSGFGYTWPVPVPMYALDHCIHSSRIMPTRYELSFSRYSDHRLQVFDFQVVDETE